MKFNILFLFTMSILVACQSKDSVISPSAPLPAKELHSVSYGPDSLQRLDAYLPANRNIDSTPAIILVHGGGWNGGSRTEFSFYIDSFQKRMPRFAVFNLDYRLVNGGNLFPTQEEDIKKAIQFISSKSGEFVFNNRKLVLVGASAGGHLVLLHGYKNDDGAVKAIVDLFGPTDLVTMYNQPWHPLVPLALQMVTGTTPQQNPGIYESSSPVRFITPQSPPTLILHGGADSVVNVSQSKLLQQKLQAANVPNELVIYPGEGHGWRGTNMNNSIDRIEAFLNKYVH